jgi:hypothetical protein
MSTVVVLVVVRMLLCWKNLMRNTVGTKWKNIQGPRPFTTFLKFATPEKTRKGPFQFNILREKCEYFMEVQSWQCLTHQQKEIWRVINVFFFFSSSAFHVVAEYSHSLSCLFFSMYNIPDFLK